MRNEQGKNDPTGEKAVEIRLAQVQEGMKVIDSSGREVGKVSFVKLGDPGAASDAGEALGEAPGEVIGAPSSAVGESGAQSIVAVPVGPGGDDDLLRVPAPLRSRLLREGYLRVSHPGLFGKSHYVQASQIASVGDDTVTLAVARDRLATEV